VGRKVGAHPHSLNSPVQELVHETGLRLHGGILVNWVSDC
jgi:hypothetical protein